MNTTIFQVLSALVAVLLLGACQIERPGISNPKAGIVGFDHLTLKSEQTCETCHEKKRPAPKVPETHPDRAAVPHGHLADCKLCHIVSNWKTITKFKHTLQDTKCFSCHSGETPKEIGRKRHGDGGECIACHNTDSWRNTKTFSHKDSKNECQYCHDSNRPARFWDSWERKYKVGHYQNTEVKGECSSCHETKDQRNGSQIDVNKDWKYTHMDSQKSLSGYCLPCHENAGRKAHFGSSDFFYPKERCLECHRDVINWEHVIAR